MAKRMIAKAAGYYVRRGEFTGQGDNRLDRFYIGREGEAFRPIGEGYKTALHAWTIASELASRFQ